MNLKLLPCPRCGDRGAMLPPSQANPEGEPSVAARRPEKPYKCYRCKRPHHVTPAEWAAIPALTYGDIERLAHKHRAPGLIRRMRADLEGLGLKTPRQDEVRDLLEAGITAEDVVGMSREPLDTHGTIDLQADAESVSSASAGGGSNADAAATEPPSE